MLINIVLNNGISLTKDIPHGTAAEMIYQEINPNCEHQALLCKVNNAYRSLTHRITHPCNLEFLDMRNNYAWLVYQSGLIFLYKKAVIDVLGDVKVEILNSLNKGLYTIIRHNFDRSDVTNIYKRMQELVALDLPIIKEKVSADDIRNIANTSSDFDRIRLVDSLDNLSGLEIYSLGNLKELFYSIMVPSTRYLDKFELIKYRNGILLRYPHISDPKIMPIYEDQKLLYDAFSEANRWSKLLNVTSVADLNQKIAKHDYEELIMLQEALHEKKISDIADRIKYENKRIILIAGPSSSGKTSFAKRLCIQLRVIGLKPLYLGTDDYFVERDETVLDENGEKDFESIRAVDIKLFNQQMNDLLNGLKVDIPRFDFLKGTKVFGERIISIDRNQPIVIEGIHALNEILTSDINDHDKFKIYISPLTSQCIDDLNRIPTTDARMLRRLVRDYRFRGRSAQMTIDDWPKVRKGEDKNIFPYFNEADVFFNTNYIYEIAVLKKYAEPLLNEVKDSESEYAEAQRMLSFLRFFATIEDDSMIANNSILREFIGGSVLVK